MTQGWEVACRRYRQEERMGEELIPPGARSVHYDDNDDDDGDDDDGGIEYYCRCSGLLTH